MKVNYSIEILKPPAEVFPWLAEPEKAKQWQGNVKGGRILENRPEVVGTKFIEVIEEDGKSLEMQGIISKYVKNRNIGFALESKIHKVDVDYIIELHGDNSILMIDAKIKWKFPMNIISIFLGKKMREGITKQIESECSELKRICEQ